MIHWLLVIAIGLVGGYCIWLLHLIAVRRLVTGSKSQERRLGRLRVRSVEHNLEEMNLVVIQVKSDQAKPAS